MTHTETHTGKRADKNNGEDRTYLPQYTERKGSKSPENGQTERPDTLRNQQVMCSSHTTSSKKALKSQRFRGFCFFQYICEGHFCVLFVSYSRKNVFRRAKKPVRINT